MTDIYLVITEDRHENVQVTPFADEAEALAFAEEEVQACVRHPELLEEPDARELNEHMAADGWIFYCRYGVEGDCVRVLRRELRHDELKERADTMASHEGTGLKAVIEVLIAREILERCAGATEESALREAREICEAHADELFTAASFLGILREIRERHAQLPQPAHHHGEDPPDPNLRPAVRAPGDLQPGLRVGAVADGRAAGRPPAGRGVRSP